MKSAMCIAFLCGTLTVVCAQQIDESTFQLPGASLTRPFAVNARGQVAGLYRDGSGSHAFVREADGTYNTFSVPFAGATFTNATGLNAQGDVVGRWTDAAGMARGYLRDHNGQFTPFDPPSPCSLTNLPAAPHGINSVGEIVGRCFDAARTEHGYLLKTDGTLTIIDYPGAVATDAWMINDADDVVGDYQDGTGVHGYHRTVDGQFVTVAFPGVATSSARGINDRGDITGVYRASSNANPQTLPGDGGFVLRDGTYTNIDPPADGVGVGHVVINNRRLIVGDYIVGVGGERGFFGHLPQ